MLHSLSNATVECGNRFAHSHCSTRPGDGVPVRRGGSAAAEGAEKGRVAGQLESAECPCGGADGGGGEKVRLAGCTKRHRTLSARRARYTGPSRRAFAARRGVRGAKPARPNQGPNPGANGGMGPARGPPVSKLAPPVPKFTCGRIGGSPNCLARGRSFSPHPFQPSPPTHLVQHRAAN
jgi:hypothetical protein